MGIRSRPKKVVYTESIHTPSYPVPSVKQAETCRTLSHGVRSAWAGEGSLDPLRLSQIADELAMQLVPESVSECSGSDSSRHWRKIEG